MKQPLLQKSEPRCAGDAARLFNPISRLGIIGRFQGSDDHAFPSNPPPFTGEAAEEESPFLHGAEAHWSGEMSLALRWPRMIGGDL